MHRFCNESAVYCGGLSCALRSRSNGLTVSRLEGRGVCIQLSRLSSRARNSPVLSPAFPQMTARRPTRSGQVNISTAFYWLSVKRTTVCLSAVSNERLCQVAQGTVPVLKSSLLAEAPTLGGSNVACLCIKSVLLNVSQEPEKWVAREATSYATRT
jgi:hypothetical protein